MGRSRPHLARAVSLPVRALTSAPEAIKLSPMDLNLTDMPAVERCLRSLAEPRRDSPGRRTYMAVSGSTPDCVVVAGSVGARNGVAVGQFPAHAEEQEALIRWRLGQEQLLPLAGAKIVWQGFPSHGVRGERAHVVLAVAIQEAILKQYESLCESVGLLPQEDWCDQLSSL